MVDSRGGVTRKLSPVLVPTSDVPDVFNQLVENIPDTVQIDPLLGYFAVYLILIAVYLIHIAVYLIL